MEKGRQWEHVEGGCEASMAWWESPKEKPLMRSRAYNGVACFSLCGWNASVCGGRVKNWADQDLPP